MPRTQGDKIDEALVIVNTLTVRLDSMSRDLESITAAHSQTTKAVGEVGPAIAVSRQQIDELNRWKSDLGPIADLKSEIALLRRDIDELRKTRDEWGRRIWTMAGPLLGAVIGAPRGYYLRK
jgi:hypothetical protein